MSVSAAPFLAATEATWPAAKVWRVGPFALRDGQGGGQRVSSATLMAAFEESDIDAAEAGMRAIGQRPLFQLRGATDAALDSALEARGYATKDPTVILTLPIDRLTDKPIPRVTAFSIWEPLAIMNEIWATDGIGPERQAVMARAEIKTAVLARWNEKPAGAAFVGVHEDICMVHGLVVLAHQRRQGVAEWMMRRAALWGQSKGAGQIAVLCLAANTGAIAFYRALGFDEVGGYHYRVAPE